MKNLLTLIVLCWAFLPGNAASAQEAPYDIHIQVKGIDGDSAILAYYYMDKKYISDTLVFDAQGSSYIRQTDPISTGVYMIAFPSMGYRYFELLLGEERSFSMTADTSDFIGSMVVEGSVENRLFYDNMRYLLERDKEASSYREQMKNLDEGDPKHDILTEKLEDMRESSHKRREELFMEYPDAYYTAVMKAMMDVELPDNPDPSDSSFAYRYYQQHYFDHIDFNDERLTRTPFLLRKIITFLDKYTIPVPDSINVAAEMIIDRSRVNYEMFQFCLVGIFNRYASSKIMAHELVYVNLARKYYLSGIADWVTEEQYAKFKDRIARIEPTLLGTEAPEIIIADLDGRMRRLHAEAESNDYTILAIWNSSCGHCQKEIPRLKAVYDSTLTQLGKIGVFAVSTELETDEWTKFIDEKQLKGSGWIHAHDPMGRNPFRIHYDVESTPIIIVLDRNKKILAKRINLDDIGSLIEFDLASGQHSGDH